MRLLAAFSVMHHISYNRRTSIHLGLLHYFTFFYRSVGWMFSCFIWVQIATLYQSSIVTSYDIHARLQCDCSFFSWWVHITVAIVICHHETRFRLSWNKVQDIMKQGLVHKMEKQSLKSRSPSLSLQWHRHCQHIHKKWQTSKVSIAKNINSQ